MKLHVVSSMLLISLPLIAQLPPPNKAGVSAGHDVLRVKDMDAANKFWQTIGGKPLAGVGSVRRVTVLPNP
jgi:hypothetical protein